MTHRKNSARMLRLATAAVVALAPAFMVGCEPPPPPPAPIVKAPPPPPPPPPALTPVRELMAQYDIDPRVNLPEERAPGTDEQRIAVLKFFDAFARGNAEALRSMLSGPDQLQLDGMVKGDTFKNTTASITRIDVQCGRQDSDDCALAVFHVGSAFEPQLWVYTAGDTAEFDSVATPPDMMEKLSGNNWIAAWYEVLKLELAKADEPDVVIELVQTDRGTEDASSDEKPAEGAPGAPQGVPGRRLPTGPPIAPPRAPGFGK
jgi:hypothetical protein